MEAEMKKWLLSLCAVGIVFLSQAGVQILAEPAHLILADDAPHGTIVFRAEINGKPMRRTDLDFHAIGETAFRKSQQRSDLEGKAVFQFPAAAAAPKSVIVAIPGLAALETCVEVIPAAEWNRNAAVAKTINLKQNLRILFIGDSLSDFSRGRNYADKLQFWLSLNNPGKVSFRNAAVGGDYILRVRERLNGTVGGEAAYRQEMYDELEQEKPDLVFIFLGHNDTRATSETNFAAPLVTPEAQEKAYREVIQFIRHKIGGKIVLVSASSSDFAICREATKKRAQAAPGKVQVLFGTPELMEGFNDVLKRLAAEYGLDYVDVYRPTADKASLFFPADGVHLTEKGHRFIAAELLNYFAEQPPYR
jgi:lysophospholipase L1-like esterase